MLYLEGLGKNLGEQVLLAAEIVVDAAFGDTGLLGDFA